MPKPDNDNERGQQWCIEWQYATTAAIEVGRMISEGGDYRAAMDILTRLGPRLATLVLMEFPFTREESCLMAEAIVTAGPFDPDQVALLRSLAERGEALAL